MVKRLIFTLPACLLCLIAPFIHQAGFEGTEYFSQDAFILPMIVAGVSLVASLITKYGSLVMFLGTFASLLSFVNVSYLYLSSVFFNGIAGTIPGIFEQIGFHYSFCLIAYVVAMILSIVALFLPGRKFDF